MVAKRGEDFVPVPLEEVAGKKRLVPMNHPLVQAARAVGTCLGDKIERSLDMRAKMSILFSVFLLCLALSGGEAAAAAQPNFVIIIGDDCTYNDLPLYGGVNVQTPRIDKLASEGLTFNNAFLTIAMCNPCRTELYTGRFPARNGACWNHSAARTGTKSVVHHLGDLGYRVALSGKNHVGPRKSFPFEILEGLEPSCVAETARYDNANLREFITRDDAQPFLLVVALVVPHSPWTVGDPAHFEQEALQLPENLADTPETRSDFIKYLAEIEVLDQQVGKTLDMLEDCGKTENTLVLFTSEQGSQFPGNKWTNWNTGVHTTFVVRWPGKVAAGKRTDAIVQFADVLPTFIDAAGGTPSASEFDGRSFLPVLSGEAARHRDYAYFMHNNIPEGPPYPIRAITDGTHHYIRNLTPDAIYIEKHLMGQNKWHQYWPTWVVDTTFSPRTNNLVKRYMNRPAEELYLLASDPYEMNNLAGEPAHAEAMARLSKELDAWMRRQGDPGAVLDTEAEWRASKKGNHFKQVRR